MLQHETALCKVSEVLGEIDRHVQSGQHLTLSYSYSLLALAQGASLYKLKRPQMTYHNWIQIRGGRFVTVLFYALALMSPGTFSTTRPLQRLSRTIHSSQVDPQMS